MDQEEYIKFHQEEAIQTNASYKFSIANSMNKKTLVFDEVDSGVSGSVQNNSY